MENTLENKKKFFAIYYDVPCIQNDEWIWRENDEFGKLPNGSDITYCYATLKPLSSITNEDAEGISDIVKHKFTGEMDPNVDNIKMWAAMYARKSIFISDFIRSKGYALEFMGLSVEQLEEYGWIKIKN